MRDIWAWGVNLKLSHRLHGSYQSDQTVMRHVECVGWCGSARYLISDHRRLLPLQLLLLTEKRLFFFSWTITFTQLLFQCGIQFGWYRQAEILQGQGLPHGSFARRAAALRVAVSPHPLQALGWWRATVTPHLTTHRQRDHQPSKWDPPTTSSDYNYWCAKGGDTGTDRDAQPAQRSGSCSEWGALLWLGESLSEGLGLVPQPDALRLPRPADGREDASLLHLQQSSQTHPSDEPWHQAAAHPQRPHRARAVRLHPGVLQPSSEAQALPAHRVCFGEARRDQPGIQGSQSEPVLCSYAELVEIFPAGEHSHCWRGWVDQGPLPWDEKGGEIPKAGTTDKRFKFLLQQNKRILLFEGPWAGTVFTRFKGQGSPPCGTIHPAKTLPVLSWTQQEVLWACGSNIQLEISVWVWVVRCRVVGITSVEETKLM